MSKNKPLSYEELVALAEEMSDIEYLSDDNGQDENEEINEILHNNDMNELLDRQEDEIVDSLEEHQENTEDVSEQVIVGESSVRDVINVQNKESTTSVTEFFLEK
ncbi:uncharacterized protein LOC126740814 [Anthonomus grandis grandis]|uniref:uncharacterized protein LOC126740814 n=1 Tax=Anthonomus grandis grandis TaxID=2921223 RepID=UPI0021655A49|nr:uncharacterized protein LOC126740814 [Anthonomus grandis grandis]